MEKKRREWVDNGVLHCEPVYSAAEVDDYMKAVKALVEADRAVDALIYKEGEKVSEFNFRCFTAKHARQIALAAVERLEVE